MQESRVLLKRRDRKVYLEEETPPIIQTELCLVYSIEDACMVMTAIGKVLGYLGYHSSSHSGTTTYSSVLWTKP